MSVNEEVKEIVEGIKKDVIETTAPAITEQVIKAVEEKMTLRQPLFGADADKKAEAEAREAGAEYLRKLAKGEDTKALSAGASTAGAELVPTYVSDRIITQMEKVGLVQKYATKWPMDGSNVDVPTASSVSAYRVNEGSKITSSKPTTGAVQLRGKTVGVLIPVTEKLLRNATPATVEALTQLGGQAIAKLVDQWGLLGLAGGEGVFQHASVTGVTLGSGLTDYTDVTAEDLLDAIDIMDESYVDEKTRWVMSLSVLNIFRKLRAAVGSDNQGFLFQGFGGSTPATLWDIPYSLSPVMPKKADADQEGTKFIALANFGNMIYGEPKGYSMSLSDQATVTDTDGTTLINLFEQNMVAIKVWGEIDLQLANAAKAFAWLKTAAS
jgi:HK97 family phage major capsid protein